MAILLVGETEYHKNSLRKPCINSTNNNKSEDHKKPSHYTTRVTEVAKKKKKKKCGEGEEPKSNEQITLILNFESLDYKQNNWKGKSLILRMITQSSSNKEQKILNCFPLDTLCICPPKLTISE